jgi:hypothetical protein
MGGSYIYRLTRQEMDPRAHVAIAIHDDDLLIGTTTTGPIQCVLVAAIVRWILKGSTQF